MRKTTLLLCAVLVVSVLSACTITTGIAAECVEPSQVLCDEDEAYQCQLGITGYFLTRASGYDAECTDTVLDLPESTDESDTLPDEEVEPNLPEDIFLSAYEEQYDDLKSDFEITKNEFEGQEARYASGSSLMEYLTVKGDVILLRKYVQKLVYDTRVLEDMLTESPEDTAVLREAVANLEDEMIILDGEIKAFLAALAEAMALLDDSDGDGLTDTNEAIYGTDVYNEDTDDDTLLDGLEVLVLGSDPLDMDSDNDGMSDGFEWIYRFDPMDGDEDGNAVIDGYDDYDGDELNNKPEEIAGTDPSKIDTDGDGVSDKIEVDVGTDPVNPREYPEIFDEDTDDPSTGADVEDDTVDPLLAGDVSDLSLDSDADGMADNIEELLFGTTSENMEDYGILGLGLPNDEGEIRFPTVLGDDGFTYYEDQFAGKLAESKYVTQGSSALLDADDDGSFDAYLTFEPQLDENGADEASIWFKAAEVGEISNWFYIDTIVLAHSDYLTDPNPFISRQTTLGCGNQQYRLGASDLDDDGEGDFSLLVTLDDGTSYAVSGGTYSADGYQQVTGVFTGEKLLLYVDGALMDEKAVEGSLHISQNRVSIGNYGWSLPADDETGECTKGYDFDGYMAYIRVYGE